MVDLNSLESTANDRYFVDTGDRDALYSDPNVGAPAPKPRELYFRSRETTSAGGHVDKWKPNVRLVSSRERGEGITSEQARTMARNIEEIDVTGDLADLPTLGILGKNDCDNFALQLNTLIARENAQYSPAFVGDQTIDQLTQQNAPDLDVGDRMKHVFQGEDLACGHHGATIVAQDGDDDVTLEAHVSQDIQAPKFHIRQGATGFVQDNNAGRDLGHKVEFRYWRSLDQQTVDDDTAAMERRFDRMSGREMDPMGHMGPADFLSGALGLSQVPGQRIAQERTRRQALQLIQALVDDGRWSSQGMGWTRRGIKIVRERIKTPAGVSDIQSVLAGGLLVRTRNTQEKLEYCRTKGTTRLASPDSERSQATTDLYTALSHLNPVNPNIVTLTNELATAQANL